MKIRIISDIHLEYGHNFDISYCGEKLLIIAGDLSDYNYRYESLRIIRNYIELTNNKVLYILGNHEYYKSTIDETNLFWNNNDIDNLIVFNSPKAVVIDNINFIGCTLWTSLDDGKSSNYAIQTLNDFIYIKNFNPPNYIDLHRYAVHGIENLIRKDMKNILISHHLPTDKSIKSIYKDSFTRSCLYSNLKALDNFSVCIHGHVHDSYDYCINDSRIICNPYYENTEFDISKIVEI